MITLNACLLSGLLADAKEAHTRYEERFAIEGAKPPEHKWEDWYARYVMRQLQADEFNQIFGEISCRIDQEDGAPKALAFPESFVDRLLDKG